MAAQTALSETLAPDAVFATARGGGLGVSPTAHERELNRLRSVAALLSVAVPGLGQVYQRRRALGVLCFATVALGYWTLPLLGTALHTVCVLNAYTLGLVTQLNHALLTDTPPVYD